MTVNPSTAEPYMHKPGPREKTLFARAQRPEVRPAPPDACALPHPKKRINDVFDPSLDVAPRDLVLSKNFPNKNDRPNNSKTNGYAYTQK